MTQTERVLAAARRFNGCCQADFLLPDVCDGGPPITRVAARLHDLDAQGYSFECIGWRSKTKVFRLLSEPGSEGGSGPGVMPRASGETPAVSFPAAALSTGHTLFEVGRPQRPHWDEAA